MFDRMKLLRSLSPEVGASLDFRRIYVFGRVNSTGYIARKYIANGRKIPALFIAKSQTEGRGRTPHTFHSPSGGLYMTYALGETDNTAAEITAAAGAAVCRAIDKLTGLKCAIKWVNDVYIGGKKVAGILAEGVTAHDGYGTRAILGIGVNVREVKFPDEVKKIATSIEEACGKRLCIMRLAGEILSEYKRLLGSPEALAEYKKRCIFLGKEVTVNAYIETYSATAVAIEDDYGLTVELESGERRTLYSAEVSIKIPEQ